jgi:uncharacterized coiled-coil protein SlyX
MTRDKLITIRIEGEKRDAFNQLAKAQNTDTASLLYDFINQCLSGKIDISLVTGKKQWIDKIDNQIDSERIDKLETDTQRIDNRLDTISKKLTDWIEAIDDRVTDCDQGLSGKIISLEHRLNALAMQLAIQEDRQGETPDMEPLIKEALRLDFMDDQKLIDYIESQIEDTELDESAYKDEPDKGAIGPVPGVTDSIESVTGEGTVSNQKGLTNDQLSKKIGIPTSTIEKWKGKIREGKEITSTKYPKFFKQWTLNLADSLWYEKD